MVSIVLAAVGVLIVLAVVAAITLALRHKGERAERRQALASELGWTCSGPEGAVRYHCEGTDGGTSWTLEARHFTGTGNQARGGTTTRWSVPRPVTDKVVIVGPKPPSFLGDSVMRWMIEAVIGRDVELSRPVQMIDLGSKRVAAASTDPDEARAWLSPAMESLGRFPGDKAPVVGRWKDQLFVRVDGEVEDPAVLRAMVELGLSLSEREP